MIIFYLDKSSWSTNFSGAGAKSLKDAITELEACDNELTTKCNTSSYSIPPSAEVIENMIFWSFLTFLFRWRSAKQLLRKSTRSCLSVTSWTRNRQPLTNCAIATTGTEAMPLSGRSSSLRPRLVKSWKPSMTRPQPFTRSDIRAFGSYGFDVHSLWPGMHKGLQEV